MMEESELYDAWGPADDGDLPQICAQVDEEDALDGLIICNAYPSEKALYRNAFIHRRVKAYQSAQMRVEVFYNHQPAKTPYEYDYDGVHVYVGDDRALLQHLADHDYDAFLVHFAEPSRIDPLRDAGVTQPVIVWVHGFEAEAWHRRWFNFIDDPEAIRYAVSRKDEYFKGQNRFFRELVADQDLNVSFVNVSDWFQRYVVEPDIGIEIANSTTIPNLVDETLFPFRAKTSDMRRKILSIRPYASHKYANDQTVAAIMRLSKRPYFDELEFTICGDGALFDETNAPLAAFDNVQLAKGFLAQDEIAQLHAEHGVFLCPTRFDSQGVSMCEAISSGLVAISSDVASIPEYVRHMQTGLLAEPESPQSVADNIERLFFDPDLFVELSAAGSQWMQTNCGRRATIDREIELIRQAVHGG